MAAERRLGHAAIEGLIAGQKDVMAGVINNEIVYVPLLDAITRTKGPDEDLQHLAEILAL